MKDVDFLEILFRYMYNNGEALYYERVFRELGMEDDKINIQLLFRLHRLLKSTGLVDELNKKVENQPSALQLNDDGYQMMIKYGSYKEYLKSAMRDEELERNLKKIKMRQIQVGIIVAIVTCIVTLLLSEPIKKISKLLLDWIQAS
jgi:hypothetical protein